MNYYLLFTFYKAFNIHVVLFCLVMSNIYILSTPLKLSTTPKHTCKAKLNSSRPDINTFAMNFRWIR